MSKIINITNKAAEKLNEVIQKADSPEKIMLRVTFAGYGWGGPKLGVTLDELKNDEDVVVQVGDIKVVYDSMLEPYINGIVINYSNSFFNRGFSVSGGSSSSC